MSIACCGETLVGMFDRLLNCACSWHPSKSRRPIVCLHGGVLVGCTTFKEESVQANLGATMPPPVMQAWHAGRSCPYVKYACVAQPVGLVERAQSSPTEIEISQCRLRGSEKIPSHVWIGCLHHLISCVCNLIAIEFQVQ